ncbi:MAG: 50S ribosomal protein L30 [Candidatus Thermoplasmatota archaeon]
MSIVNALIRVRGGINTSPQVKNTLRLLCLTRVNHCTIIPLTKEYEGMLRKVKDYITWGEIDEKTLTKLIKKRGFIIGKKRITDEYMKENTNYDSIEKFANAIIEGKAKYKDLKDVCPVFRLSPPVGGYKKTKIEYKFGGALGGRGKDICKLIEKMLGD